MTSSIKINHAGPGETPPINVKRVYKWADLPGNTKPAKYSIECEGQEPRTITVLRRKRQVLEGLMKSPIRAASYCRISDQVLPLLRDHGVDFRCTIYKNDPDTGRDVYGVYTLENTVRRIEGGAA